MKKIISITAILSSFLFVTNSCDNTDPSNDLQVSRVNYVHAIQNVRSGTNTTSTNGNVNLFVDGIQLNSTAFIPNAQRGYTNLESGERQIQIRNIASTNSPATVPSAMDYINVKYNFGAFKSYTVFAAGNANNNNSPMTTEAIVVEDDLTTPKSGNYRIRYANMISDSDPVTLEVAPVFTAFLKSNNTAVTPAETLVGTYTTLFSNIAYKQVTNFSEQNYNIGTAPAHPDATKYYKATGTFSVKQSSGTTTLRIISTTALAPSRNYTFLGSGLKANTNGVLLSN